MIAHNRRDWQDKLGILLGDWIALSPLVFRFERDARAVENAISAGVALALVNSGALRLPVRLEKMTVALLGLWLLVAPRALGFGGRFEEAYATMVVGVAVVAIAAASLLARWNVGSAPRDKVDR